MGVKTHALFLCPPPASGSQVAPSSQTELTSKPLKPFTLRAFIRCFISQPEAWIPVQTVISQNKQASKPLKGAYHIPFKALLGRGRRPSLLDPSFQGRAGRWAEQTSKQATPPIGLWFFVERSRLIVLEPKANGRRTTDKGETTTDQGLPIPVLVRGHTDKAHIF